MMTGGTLRRVAVVGLASLMVGVGTSAAAAPVPGDGEWIGFLRYDGEARFTTSEGTVNTDHRGAGGFAITLTSGRATGDYGFNVDTALPDLGATARGSGTGTVSGNYADMTLTLASVTVTEDTVGFAFTFSAAELGNPTGELVVTHASCDMLAGTWNHEYEAAANVTTSGIGGTWTATRMTDAGEADEARRQMEALQARADVVLEQFADGGLDIGEVRAFLREAEAAAGTLSRGECDRSSTDMRHLGVFVVATMLDEAAGYIDELTLAELLELIRSGTRTGVFLSDDDLRSAYESELLSLATEAAAEGDLRTVNRLLAAAEMAGWYDTADAIEELRDEAS